MADNFIDISAFRGIDNVSDPMAQTLLLKNGLFFREIDNIDIDDNFKPHRRDGWKGSFVDGATRNLWAAPSGRICLYTLGTDFKKLNTDWTSTTLVTGINPDDTMAYVEVGNYVYFSNMSVVGYIDARTGVSYSFPTPTQDFKVKMSGGQILEHHYNRLYAANGMNLFYSDATILTQMDSRKNAMAYPSRITMVKSVLDGIYVSDSERIYFLAGRTPEDLVSREVLDIPAIEGMSASVLVKRRKNTFRTTYFLTKKGIYEGFPEGVVMQQQEGRFKIDNIERGCAIVKNGDYQQFLAIGKLKSGIGDAIGEFREPAATMTGGDSQYGPEILVNGGMEEGDPPTGWVNGPPLEDCDFEIFERTSTKKVSGNYSLHCVDNPEYWGFCWQPIPIFDTSLGRTFKLSFWYYLVSGKLLITDSTYVPYSSIWMEYDQKNEWIHVEVTWTLSKTIDTPGLTGILFSNASGTESCEFYIDDVSVKEVL